MRAIDTVQVSETWQHLR